MARITPPIAHKELATPASADDQGAWVVCSTGAMAGAVYGSPAATSQMMPAVWQPWQQIYQWAYEQAARTARHARPGRYIEPGSN